MHFYRDVIRRPDEREPVQIARAMMPSFQIDRLLGYESKVARDAASRTNWKSKCEGQSTLRETESARCTCLLRRRLAAHVRARRQPGDSYRRTAGDAADWQGSAIVTSPAGSTQTRRSRRFEASTLPIALAARSCASVPRRRRRFLDRHSECRHRREIRRITAGAGGDGNRSSFIRLARADG